MIIFAFFFLATSIRRKPNSAQIDISRAPIPISVSMDHVKKTGTGIHCTLDVRCTTYALTPECGSECYTENPFDGVFEYTFEGVGFQVFGTTNTNHETFSIYLDDKIIQSVDENGPRKDYAHLYTSDILQYGIHTIKINSSSVYELHKFTYWPTLDGTRVNATEIVPVWTSESDDIGGILQTINSNAQEQTITINCSKLWIIGSKSNNNGNIILTIDGTEVVTINEKSDTNTKMTIVYQKELELGLHTLKFTHGSDYVTLNCIFYESKASIAESSSSTVPISIPTNSMTITGSKECNTDNVCPSDKIPTTPCGQKCYTTGTFDASFEYTFTGVQFEIYGTNRSSHGNYDVYIDNDLETSNVDQTITNGKDVIYYTLQYRSKILPYGEHTIKTVGKAGTKAYEIFKFSYYPTLRGIRINTTDIEPVWAKQIDDAGGFKEIANTDAYKKSIKTFKLTCSKIWIIGSKGPNYGKFNFWMDNEEKVLVNEYHSTGVTFAVVYETDSFEYREHTFNIEYDSGNVEINCIFYDPFLSNAEEPVSVPISAITITGDHGCNIDSDCSNDTITNTFCGKKCWTNTNHDATFEYTFTGVLAQVYGTYDQNHGGYDVLIDGQVVDTVSQTIPSNSKSQYNILQYTSKILPYGEHTIKTAGKGSKAYEISKFAYYPSLAARRINFTDFTKSGTNQFSTTSDGNGGLYLLVESGTVLSKKIQCSKFWIIGSKSSTYRSMNLKFGNYEAKLNEYLDLGEGKQLEKVIVFESPDFPYTVSDLVLTATGPIALYCIYYLDNPPIPSISQTPEPTPTETPTPLPSTTPGPPEILEVFDANRVGERIVKIVNDAARVIVSVKTSNFSHITHTDNGGAIEIKDAGFLCSNIFFDDCKTSNFGGGIYIYSTFDFEAPITLDHLSFTECKSKCGGAVYIYSTTPTCDVRITSCTFTSNGLIEENNGNLENQGGSAIYLSVLKGKLHRNKLKGNSGNGGAIKINNMFNEVNGGSAINMLDAEKRSVTISECEFDNSKSSIFYVASKKGSKLELSDCSFTGELDPDTHYIDGLIMDKKAPKLVVKNCKFAYNLKKSLNLDAKNNFISIDAKDQVFDSNKPYNKEIKPSSTHINRVSLPIMTIVSVSAAILIFIFIFKYENNNEISEDENQSL